MKKILITVMMCVLLLCQTGWGCKDEPQDFVGGLVDIVLDVVTMPCSLLATCLGLDACPCVCPQYPKALCAHLNERRQRPCVTTAPLKSANPYSVPVTRSVSHPKKSQPARFAEPLIPVQKPKTETPTPAVSNSFPEPTRVAEPKAETTVPLIPQVTPVPSTITGSVASPLKPENTKPSEEESSSEKDLARPKLPDVIPLAPDNFISKPKEEIQEVRKPIVSEYGVAEAKVENPLPAPEVVEPKSVPESRERVKEKPKQRSKTHKSPCTPVYPPACGPRFFYR